MSARFCTLADSPALPLVLQHDSLVQHPLTVMQLACTSRGLQTAVLQHCKGRLRGCFGPTDDKQVEQFAAWLVKRSQLLGCLRLSPAFAGYRPLPSLRRFWQRVETQTAGALQRHVQQEGPVMLKQLDHLLAGPMAGQILHAVSPNSLTALSLRPGHHDDAFDLCGCDLAAFSKLEVLEIRNLPASQTQTVVAAMSALVSLKDLTLFGYFDVQQLADFQSHLSTRLTSLILRGFHATADPTGFVNAPHQLHHSVALQELDTGLITEDSELPQHITSLRCMNGTSTLPLLACSKLQCLDMICCDTPAADLCLLSDLACLTDVSLTFSFSHPGSADRAAAAFSQVPLSTALRHLCIHLDAGNTNLEAQTLQELRWLSGLTCLNLTVVDHPLPASPTQLAAALRHLTALKLLELDADPGPHLLQPVQQPPPAPPAIDAEHALHLLGMFVHAGQDAALQLVLGFPPEAELYAAVQAALAAGGQALAELPAMLEWDHPEVAAQLQQVIAAIQQHHQQLNQQLQEEAEGDWVYPDMLPLTEAIAGLPELVSLKLKGSGLVLEAVEPLTRMTRLTRLTISGEDFGDLELNKLAFSLTGLKRLSLSNGEVTDASLLVVGQLLRQLTELELTQCVDVTDAGVMQLTGLLDMELLDAAGAPNVSEAAVTEVMACIEAQRQSAVAAQGV